MAEIAEVLSRQPWEDHQVKVKNTFLEFAVDPDVAEEPFSLGNLVRASTAPPACASADVKVDREEADVPYVLGDLTVHATNDPFSSSSALGQPLPPGPVEDNGIVNPGNSHRAASSHSAAPRPENQQPKLEPLTRHLSVSDDSRHRIHWAVDSRILKSRDTQAISPRFELCLGQQYPSVAFNIMMGPKGGGGFKKSDGKGKLELKCATQFPPTVKWRVGISGGTQEVGSKVEA